MSLALADVAAIEARPGKPRRLYPEILVFASLLLALNLHALVGVALPPQAYFPERVRDGEWWRVLSHPFVHVTWYHLLLDGAAFLVLYQALEAPRWWKRLLYAAAAAAGSLGLALAVDPRVESIGLCGLSGAAHGLMAIGGLEMLSRRPKERGLRALGWLALGIVLAKSLYEFAAGRVVFESLHAGMTGTPIASSHLGGVLGAVAAYAIFAIGPAAARGGRTHGHGARRGK